LQQDHFSQQDCEPAFSHFCRNEPAAILGASIPPMTPWNRSLLVERGPPANGHHSADAPDPRVQKEIRELLDLLPADVVAELNAGKINLNDLSFLDGLSDHISRLAVARPRTGQRLLTKLVRVKKLIRRELHQSDPSVKTADTVAHGSPRVGRNDPCPCGSGQKFKQCCLRRTGGWQSR
jgi:hypothetical protein